MSPRTLLFAETPQLYAAVERRDAPELRDRPLLVGGDPRKRGRVQAASAEALEAGVRIDMPMLEALTLCPSARTLRTDMPRYREVSRQLFASLRRVVPRLEPLGLGAAWFDLGGADARAEPLARQLIEAVAESPGLPLRVGISSRKFLARLAAEEAREGEVRRIPSGEERRFLDPLPVTRLEGVGQKTAARLAELGAHVVADVVALGRQRLEEAFGTHGLRIFSLASGEDDAGVRAARHPQSLSREATLRAESLDLSLLSEHLLRIAQELEAELLRQSLVASRVALRIRFGDGSSATRSRTLASPAETAREIHAAALALLARLDAGSRAVRGAGLQLGRLGPASEKDRQIPLFPPKT